MSVPRSFRSFTKTASVVVTTSVVLVTAAACGGSDDKSAKSDDGTTTIRIGVGAPTAEHSLVAVAQDLGLFKKHGINAKVELVQAGGPAVTAGIVGGSLDFGVYSGPSVEQAIVQGADLKYVGVWMHRTTAAIVGAPGIDSITDVKGKPVAVSAPGGLSGIFTDKGLRDGGLDPKKDVVRQNVAGQAAAMNAFVSGQVKAALLGGPQTFSALAKVKGSKILLDFADGDFQWPGVGIVTTGSYIKKDAEAVQNVVAALQEAAKAYQDPAQADKIKDIISKFTQITDDSVITQSYEPVAKLIDPSLVPRAEDEENVLKQIEATSPAAKKFTGADMFDPKFTEAVK